MTVLCLQGAQVILVGEGQWEDTPLGVDNIYVYTGRLLGYSL